MVLMSHLENRVHMQILVGVDRLACRGIDGQLQGTDVIGTFRETIANIDALPKVPEFLLHTGDLTHLSDPRQFDTLAQMLGNKD